MLILFILLIQFLLWTSVGQTFMAQKATSYLETRLNTKVQIDKVDISFFKFIRFENFYMEDLDHDTLFYIEKLDASIDFFKMDNDTILIDIGTITISQPTFRLQQNEGDSTGNLRFLIESFSGGDTTSSNSQLLINANNIHIVNGDFIWDNENIEPKDFGIDWDHIHVSEINLDIRDFKMVNDSFNGQFHKFSWNEKSGFILNEFTGNAIFSPTKTQIENLHVVTPHSDISLDLNYTYDSIGSYADFNNAVYMKYALDTSQVSISDIAYYAPELQGADYTITAFGSERGPVSDMKFNELYLQYGEATVVHGRIFISGLPEIESTNFNCRFKKLSSNYTDLNTIKTYPFTQESSIEIPEMAKNVGTTNFIGYFNGFYNDFVTYGTFTNNAGLVKTDLKLQQNDDHGVNYSGNIRTTDLDLDRITQNEKLFGKASIDIEVNGSQLAFDEMNLEVKGRSSKFDFLGYTYTDVEVDGKIKDQTISGLLNVIDTNVQFMFDGSISLKNELPRYKFNAKIDHLRPKQIHLLEKDSSATLSTEMFFNFSGNSLDNITGGAGLRNFYFQENEDIVQLETVQFLAFNSGKGKKLSLHSDNMDLLIEGEFYFEEAFQSLSYITYKWLPSIFSEVPVKPKSKEVFELHLKAHQFSGFSKIFIPEVTFKDSLNIDFWFDSETEKIKLQSNSNRMFVFNKELDQFKLNAQLTLDTLNLKSTANKLFFNDSTFIENFSISSNADTNLIISEVKWSDKKKDTDHSGTLNFDFSFEDPENFNVNFYDSWIEINDTTWTIHDSSRIIRNIDEYQFDQIKLTQNNQDFIVNGFISRDAEKSLFIKVDSFDLVHLNPILRKQNIELMGSLEGEIEVKDFYDQLKIYSNSQFKQLQFNGQKIGDGDFISEWVDEAKKFDIKVDFQTEKFKTINLLGSYFPQKTQDQLDFEVSLNQFPIKTIEPFFDEFISDVQGSITGAATINGTIMKPEFNGDFELNKMSVTVEYLNETLTADQQKLFIIPDLIGADNLRVTDEKGQTAEINFSLFHQNFDSINMDLSVTSLDLFRAFNTTKEDNDYFYGNIYISPGSTIGIETDYVGNMNLVANVKTGQGTKITIPFYDEGEVQQNDYIYFVNVDTPIDAPTTPVENLEKESGLNLDMSIELTPDAQIELIFDEFSADKIKAKGIGNINMQINDEDEFLIYGNYEITEGNYLFTFSQIISKNFEINPDSRITWNGDPYKGQADITASYKVRTTLYDLGIPMAYDTNELKKRVPVEVVLKMTGNYMNPTLNFSFILPTKYDEIQSMLNVLDESERNKQVFGLLILNKFMPITGVDVNSGSSALSANTSEVLSNQLSSWLSKIDDDFDIGVRYNPGDKISADEVEIALSTQLLNDRVLLEGNVGISGNSPSSTQTNNFVGEFTISYKINKKGNIVGKVFNRSNELNPVYQNISPYTQGLGIAYNEPFRNLNNLGCIMSNHLKKEENKRDCQAEYISGQIDNEDENLAKIQKRIAKSREKQNKRKKRAEKRKEKAAKKEE